MLPGAAVAKANFELVTHWNWKQAPVPTCKALSEEKPGQEKERRSIGQQAQQAQSADVPSASYNPESRVSIESSLRMAARAAGRKRVKRVATKASNKLRAASTQGSLFPA
jgi:hypothetical protein